jgi:hypothetical protein
MIHKPRSSDVNYRYARTQPTICKIFINDQPKCAATHSANLSCPFARLDAPAAKLLSSALIKGRKMSSYGRQRPSYDR